MFRLNSLLERSLISMLVVLFLLVGLATIQPVAKASEPNDEFADENWADDEFLTEYVGSNDPFEEMNRKFFVFNDRLYFWVLKPVAEAYGSVVPFDIRLSLRRAVDNIYFPIRAVNNILQGKVENTAIELVRFVVNSTLGIVGLTDPAKDLLNLTAPPEDLGQTLGKYGMKSGPYLYLPFLGPTNIRDAVGITGDYFLNPVSYVTVYSVWASSSYTGAEKINYVSLILGKYEKLKEESMDPYVAIRDAYEQNRASKINDQGLKSPIRPLKLIRGIF